MTIKTLYPAIRPTLDLNFATARELDPRITFTRASSGTYVDKDGLIRTAGKDEARFDHNLLTKESLGLLIEEQRTNLVLQSATFQPSSGGFPASYTVDQVAPDGTTTASRQTATDPRTFTDYTGIANAQYTFSFYCKVTSGTQSLSVFLKNAASDTVISSTSFTATTSWQRVAITGTTNGATTGARIEVAGPVLGAPAGTVFWGAQLEAGNFPTSYIPTISATVTRSADVVSISGANFSSWFNATTGTLFTDASIGYTVPGTVFPLVGSLNDGTTNNRIENGFLTSSLASLEVSTGGVTQAALYPSNSALARKLASSYAANDFANSVNGGAVSTDSSGTVPTVDRLFIGSRSPGGGGVNILNGSVKRLTYWPRRLSDSTLRALTS